MDFRRYAEEMAGAARKASRVMAELSTEEKNRALVAMAEALEGGRAEIEEANLRDLAAGEKAGLKQAFIDRLRLTPARLEEMCRGLRQVAGLDDYVGTVIDRRVRPNGLEISRVRVPLGVIAIIYESRPNVTVDAAGLCLKSGNAVILRGGKEAVNSNRALAGILRQAVRDSDFPAAAIQVVDVVDRAVVDELLKLNELIDVVIPRGGESLIRAVASKSAIPVIKHYKGVCHIYVAATAGVESALRIVDNAKTQRPGVCNAVETLLVDRALAESFLPRLYDHLRGKGVEFRGCPATRSILPQITKAAEDDWYAEYLDLILAVKVVNGVEEAIAHIEKYGSRHSDAILTGSDEEAETFLRRVDSSAVYANASTRFTDGGQFGLGAEIGISTDKLHARGPMGLEELTTYKWVIRGSGQARP